MASGTGCDRGRASGSRPQAVDGDFALGRTSIVQAPDRIGFVACYERDRGESFGADIGGCAALSGAMRQQLQSINAYH